MKACPDCKPASSRPQDYCEVHRVFLGSMEQQEAAVRKLVADKRRLDYLELRGLGAADGMLTLRQAIDVEMSEEP